MLLAILGYGGYHASVIASAGLLIAGGVGAALSSSRSLRVPLAVWVPLIAGGLGLLQLVPVPHALLGMLSPETTGLRAFALESTWSPITYAPGETGLAIARSVLVALAALAGALLVEKTSIKTPVQMICIGGAVVLAVIIGHAAVGAESIYGVKAAVGRGFSAPLGPFVNANHLAAFLVLVVPVAAGFAWAGPSRVVRAGAATLALAGAAALVATFSRGGMVALLAATVVFAMGAWAVTGRLRVALLPLAGGLAAAVLGVAWTGGHVLFLFNRDLFLAPRGKGPIWEAGLAMLAEHPWLGIGRGSFGSIYPRFGLPEGAVQAAHAENWILAMLLDFGLPLGLLVLAGAALVARSALKSRIDPLRVGAWAGLAGLVVHNLVDYNIELPGVAVPAAILLGALCASEGEDRGRAREHPVLRGADLQGRSAVALLAGMVLFGGLGLGLGHGGSVKEVDARLTKVLADRPVTPRAEAIAVDIASERPADPWSWLPLGEAVAESRPADALVYINRAMVLDPRAARPHRSAAWALLRLGRTGQASGEARRALEKAPPDEFEDMLRAALTTWSSPEEIARLMPREAAAAERAVAFFRREDRAEEAIAAARAWVASEDAGARAKVILAELLSEVRGEAEDLEARLLLVDALDRTVGWELDRALLIYGRVQLRRGGLGWTELQDVLRGIPRGPDPRVSARASYLEGRLAEAGGRLDDALERAETAVRLMPDAPEYRGELARVRRRVAEQGEP
jgi:putative inorganic carbon (HCO3(-)) transporter